MNTARSKPHNPSCTVVSQYNPAGTRTNPKPYGTKARIPGQQQSHMANRTIFTRVYSKSSAAQLIAAKSPKGTLSHGELLAEFQKHAYKSNQEATALVSVSDRIIDTVKRALDKHYTNGESPEDIWIAFIETPTKTPPGVHAANGLAKESGFPRPNLFCHEYIFEWAIPEEYVLHTVSLQILMDRGLDWEKYSTQNRPLSTKDLRHQIANELQHTSSVCSSWDVGIELASFARLFGARAPLSWIAHQLFYDCVWTEMDPEQQVVRLKFANENIEIVDFEFFCDLDDGVDTALNDWWLADTSFFLRHKAFEDWRVAMLCDTNNFCESWHDVDVGDTVGKILWDEALKATIEAEAVMMGL
ncbi:hypothetical protein TruAng_008697 [Truncatella angustata]|nr:hypothetical protein TruAng_008697 [Truncatella angustata]